MNYVHFFIAPERVNATTRMAGAWWTNFTRGACYTTSAFAHIQPGGKLPRRGVGPHICESRKKARRASMDSSGRCG